MPNSDDVVFDDFELELFLDDIKQLTLTRNELLYLSDSVTLLLEHTTEQGKLEGFRYLGLWLVLLGRGDQRQKR